VEGLIRRTIKLGEVCPVVFDGLLIAAHSRRCRFGAVIGVCVVVCQLIRTVRSMASRFLEWRQQTGSGLLPFVKLPKSTVLEM